ncbi:MAG TPA: SAVED domain-containing protein [Fluviicola sp.]|nr:SAVED domain-containing protein [Fluviicola sp.]
MAKTRTKVPEGTQILLWAQSAGRCQFRGCGEHLFQDHLTLKFAKFGELAHIIGASEAGPRGSKESEKYEIDPTNIIMLCSKHHTLIDKKEHVAAYTVDLLREMKAEHENRVRDLLDTKRNQTSVVVFTCPIKSQPVNIEDESVINAILPNYADAAAHAWHRISVQNFRYTDADWQSAKSDIDDEISQLHKKQKSGVKNHVSIFGVAPIPLLFYYGLRFSDTLPGEVFHARRAADGKSNFTWEDSAAAPVEYKLDTIAQKKGSKVLLIIALSDYLAEDKYSDLVDDEFSIYRITIDSPHPGFIKSKIHVKAFTDKFREALNLIQYENGKDCLIDIFAAIPAAIAIAAGRTIIPTKDPELFVYENVTREKIKL